MMYYNQDTIIYLNGEFVKAVDGKTDLFGQSLHYGYGVFEGIRSYKTTDGKTKIFKAEEHFQRLQNSAETLNMPFEWTSEQLIEATYQLLDRNNLQDAYIRPLIFAPANMSFTQNTKSFITIEVWNMQPFLGEKLLKVMISSFQRPNPKAFKIEAKATGHYVNSILASQEAKANGYDEALLLDMNDFIAEAPGANIFIEKNNILFTPQLGNILPGITRATVVEICNELDIEVVEKEITPGELYDADSAFFCGTAAEIIGIESINKIQFPKNWEDSIGAKIQTAYKKLVLGENIAELQIA
jgi:branched-chain amino acid aminotransferase